MRKTCIDCVRKHLAQAIVLLDEAKGRYPSHFWLAIGHIAEAEAESMELYKDFALKLRTTRQNLIANPSNEPNLLDFIEEATALHDCGDNCTWKII